MTNSDKELLLRLEALERSMERDRQRTWAGVARQAGKRLEELIGLVERMSLAIAGMVTNEEQPK